jgi:uncharacterized membrane protein YdcZ (DUF606 family)
MKSKVFATLTALVGGAAVFLSLADAFGVNVSADQSKAIEAALGVLLIVAGIWFHPSTPVGPQGDE